jgi:hypothetical protein
MPRGFSWVRSFPPKGLAHVATYVQTEAATGHPLSNNGHLSIISEPEQSVKDAGLCLTPWSKSLAEHRFLGQFDGVTDAGHTVEIGRMPLSTGAVRSLVLA